MVTPPWQLKNPIDAFIFDCDGTLSTIEGIDELAKHKQVGKEVQQLTADAMGKSGINPQIYTRRLNLVNPSQEDVQHLGAHYFDHKLNDIIAVIQLLKGLNKPIYIVSAGLLPAVAYFGERLGIPRENIYAVDVKFDAQGNFLDYDHQSPLTKSQGKGDIVTAIKTKHPRLAYIGDGLNDLIAIDIVERFIGFGGFYYRETIANHCQFYITALAMAPLLPLTLTEDEYKNLSEAEKNLYNRGLALIQDGSVTINSKE